MISKWCPRIKKLGIGTVIFGFDLDQSWASYFSLKTVFEEKWRDVRGPTSKPKMQMPMPAMREEEAWYWYWHLWLRFGPIIVFKRIPSQSSAEWIEKYRFQLKKHFSLLIIQFFSGRREGVQGTPYTRTPFFWPWSVAVAAATAVPRVADVAAAADFTVAAAVGKIFDMMAWSGTIELKKQLINHDHLKQTSN